MGFTDWFTSNKDGDTGGIPWLTNFSHNLTDKLGLPDPWNSLYGDPAKKQKAAFQQASDSLKQLAAQQRAQQMEGLARAEGYYVPAQNTYNTLYGGSLSKSPYRGGK